MATTTGRSCPSPTTPRRTACWARTRWPCSSATPWTSRSRSSTPSAGRGELQRRIGHLDPARIAGMDPAELERVFRERPALHRYPASMATRVAALCRVVAESYDGDASRIWTDARDGADLRARLLALPSIGEMKVSGLLAILYKRFGVRLPASRSSASDLADPRRRRQHRGTRAVPGAEAGVQGVAARRGRGERRLAEPIGRRKRRPDVGTRRPPQPILPIARTVVSSTFSPVTHCR